LDTETARLDYKLKTAVKEKEHRMPRALEEQVVVITGASSGIGHITARRFAEKGARVVVGARRIDVLNELVDSLHRQGERAVAVQTDVSDREQVERLALTAMERYGRIDTWVNNAGVSVYATFDKLSEQEIRRVMDVNFMGTVFGIQAALSLMRAQREGTIINIASIAGKRALPLQSVYSASKFAIVGLSEALRQELAQLGLDIHVCTLCPPAINSSLFDNALTKEGYAPRPIPLVYEPEDVAEAILDCAVSPKPEVIIGSASKRFVLSNQIGDVIQMGLQQVGLNAGSIVDWAFGKVGMEKQLTSEPKPESAPSNLFEASPRTQEHGGWSAMGRRS
jgi:short-subunit dehydrogenase